jgi:hypothetical protein
MLEKEVQKILIDDLHTRRTQDGSMFRAYVYGKTGFMPMQDKKRFDILLFHGCVCVDSPIAIELKPSNTFSEITKALHDQIPDNYLGKEYRCEKENWKGTPPVFAFTTKDAVFQGNIYTNNHSEASNFFVNRFAWRFKVGIIYKITNKFWFCYQNKLICLETGETHYQIGEENKGKREW